MLFPFLFQIIGVVVCLIIKIILIYLLIKYLKNLLKILNFFFKSILKPINIFVLILAIASIYSCIIKINKYVDDYEINTDKYKHLLKATLTLKDKKESVCAYVIYSNSDKIIFVECTTKKLTKLNQRYVISSSSEA